MIERVVTDIVEDPEQACLDFRSGEFRLPEPTVEDRLRMTADGGNPWRELRAPGNELYDWLRTNGVDLIGSRGQTGGAVFELLGEPPQYRSGDGVTFDTVDPSEILELLTSPSAYPLDHPRLASIHIQAIRLDELPASRAKFIRFRTHDGDAGVMEVLGANAMPRGVKIRYKLVQNKKEPVETFKTGITPNKFDSPFVARLPQGTVELVGISLQPAMPGNEMGGARAEAQKPLDELNRRPSNRPSPSVTFHAAGNKVIAESANGRLTAGRITLGESNVLTATGTNLIFEPRGKVAR